MGETINVSKALSRNKTPKGNKNVIKGNSIKDFRRVRCFGKSMISESNTIEKDIKFGKRQS